MSDNANAQEMKLKAIELGIIESHGTPSRKHQKLFSVAGMDAMPNKALTLGLSEISDSAISKRIEKKYRDSTGLPWDLILPEDIGSCYEMIRELAPSSQGGRIVLSQDAGRRKSGIHHTPHDVTDFMGKDAIRLLQKSNPSSLDKPVICDLAVGAGSFILQMSRIASEQSNLEVAEFLRDNAIGFDIDQEVLLVAALCFHLQAGCPREVTEYNLHCIDSLGKKATAIILQRIGALKNSQTNKADITIGNPPYVRAIAEEWKDSGFVSEDSRNLSAYFLEQACRVTKNSGVVNQIVPLSLVQSKSCQSTREMLESKCSEIEIKAFDCVPGYIFDQGKVGSNSNNSITQRVAIFNCKLGLTESPIISTSRLIRWGSTERDVLFDNLDTTILPSYLRVGSKYPLLGDLRMKKAYIEATSSERRISDIVSDSGKYDLYVPKAIRYFATASRVNLEREQEILNFDKRGTRDLTQVLVNSSFFYWYWRTVGNGFQISSSDLINLPIPSEDAVEEMNSEIERMAERLHRNRHRLTVKKSNLGEIRNIKYDLDNNLMRDLDGLVHRIFQFSETFSFNAVKSNNMSDYDLLWRFSSS